MGRLFEHIEGNRFKLSENLNEADNPITVEDDWRNISKIEEQEALQIIYKKIIPLDVADCNKGIDFLNKKQGKNYQFSHVKVEDVLRTLRKTMSFPDNKRYETTVPDPHPKLKNRRMNAFRYAIFKGNNSRSLVIAIGAKGLISVFGNIQSQLNDVFPPKSTIPLRETTEPFPLGWGNISKMEEEKGLETIRKIWVPTAVELYNKTHRVHKVSTEDILKNLRKVRHDSKQVPDDVIKYNRSDIIHYQYKVPDTKETITFMIHRFVNSSSRWVSYKDGSLMAGFFSGTALFEKPVVI
jgi:hypothetical protein